MDKPLKPSTLPGISRPGTGDDIGNRISNRTDANTGIGNRISDRTDIGNKGDIGNRTDIGNRGGIGNRTDNSTNIGNRTDIRNRTDIGNRVNVGGGVGNRVGNNNRQVNIGQINVGRNNVINKRPTWANIDNSRVTRINNRWGSQIGGMHNWRTRYPNRGAYWAGWRSGVRSSFHWHNRHPDCFRGNWWYAHPARWGGWNYGYGFDRHPWGYWWRVPTYAACASWFTWTASQAVWSQPVYYDYGQGGNVVYNNNQVYINGEQVASADEFAQSAAALATVAPPASEEVAQQVEWMPLGTFTVSSSEKDVDPTRMAQLAVSKEGIISGTLYNTESDKTQTIQGQVDKDTQRVAMRVGESEDIVIETGIYNLTQEEAPLLVHFGTDKVENWLLVRLEDPTPDDADTTATQ